jgi:myo-inositol-1(or 4)-monophosphatase
MSHAVVNWEVELKRAIEAARAAGKVLNALMRRPKTVLSEVGRDIKLQADQDAEAVILDILKQSDYPVLAEESGEHGDAAGSGPVWIVDPLDGTLNFSRGIPLCCTSIALAQGDTAILGVIYDFNRDELFTGVPGHGAWRDGEPMRVSGIREPSRGILNTGFPTASNYSDEAMVEFVANVRRFKKVRLLGSAALMLAYVACGRYEAYAEDGIMWWDVAAGIALVQAAGGHAGIFPASQGGWARNVRVASHEDIWK